MKTIVFTLIIVDSSLVGVLCGVLIFRWLERSVQKNQDKAERPTTNVMVIRPDGQGRAPREGLLNNGEVAIISENFRQRVQGVHKETEIVASNNTLFLTDPNITFNPGIPCGPEIINDKILTIRESFKKSRQSSFIEELETNLTIATAPWKDRPMPFQTSCWDAKLEKVEPGLVSHLQDLIQLYVDISLANNVVWLATEIGHRSKELDESYMKLCSGIARRIKGIVPAISEAI
jgi:hypothetical protein